MEPIDRYENFPVNAVILSSMVSLGIYASGFLIIYCLGIFYAILYILYILVLEYRLIRYHCTNCYYWGKTCGFGQGKVSAWFFKKGDTSKFCTREMKWKDMIPDLLVSLIPFVTGIFLLILKFDFVILISLLLLLFLTTFGNAFIRGSYACKYCKQRDLGCPAEALFNKVK